MKPFPVKSSVDTHGEYRHVHGSPTRTSSDATASTNDHVLEKETTQLQRTQRPIWRRHALAICIHFTFFIFYTVIVQIPVASSSRWQSLLGRRKSVLYSPANEIIEWKLHRFNSGDGHKGPYSGYPRPELDKAWEDLLGNMNMRFSKEDFNAFNRDEDGVELPDGSGYVGTLNVYHEIHCVKWMHTYMYQDHYYPNIDDDKREENRLHSEHCLNMLRKSAMCHGDVGMVTYNWDPQTVKPKASATAHQCIDWQRLADWTADRTVDMFKPGYLVHPTLGPVYTANSTQE